MRGYFVTGTDTGIGKTVVSEALLHYLRRDHARVAGFKPVASGCAMTPDGLRNSDAVLLQQAASVQLPYAEINPYAFAAPVAPHLAAAATGIQIDVSSICAGIRTAAADCVVIEGVGGWRVPLTDSETVEDLAAALGLPVLLVVGLRLGCINHALLSAAAIQARGLPLAGWVANELAPVMELAEENVQTLNTWLGVPCVARLPWRPAWTGPDFAECFRFD